jgi:hypothetical protein
MFPPSGGEKDYFAPEITKDGCIPANRSVNFNSKTIVIPFNEFIKLNNPSENIIISPAMEQKPEYVIKGKKLMIYLKSELKPGTTYTINFGNAIADITENNAASGLTYVFSTGDFLDSLQISGKVTNAFTNAPEKNVWVLLHKNVSDTAFQKCFPDYLAKTDGEGNYVLQNLSAGEYSLFSLSDVNGNYKYDHPEENIAFAGEKITVDTVKRQYDLKMFNEYFEDLKLKSSRFIWPGKMQLIFNKSYPHWHMKSADTTSEIMSYTAYKNAVGDTVDFWLRKPAKENGDEYRVVIKMNYDTIQPKYDTITFRATGVKEEIPEMKMKSNASKNFNLYSKLKIKFDRPVFLYRKEKIHLFKNDSIPVHAATEPLGYGVSFVKPWEEKTKYTIILEDSVFADVFYGKYSKADTIEFTTLKKEYFGNLFATVQVADTNYIAELLEGEKVIQFIPVPDAGPMEFTNLKPGTYRLRVYHDVNNNRHWNTGSLSEKKQPEKIYYYKEPIVIRSNWDFELNWKIEN